MTWHVEDNRYIRLRCPLCVIKGIVAVSPVCDLQQDVRGWSLHAWWEIHKQASHPYPSPIIERAEPAAVGPDGTTTSGAAATMDGCATDSDA